MRLIQRPNGIYAVDYTDADGNRRRVSTDTRDKATAKARMIDIVSGQEPAKQRAEVKQAKQATRRAQQPGAEGHGGMTVNQLLTACLRDLKVWGDPKLVRSQASMRSNVRVIAGYIGGWSVLDLTLGKLEEFVAMLEAEDYAPGTINRKLSVLSSALRTLTKEGRDGEPPVLPRMPTFPTITFNNRKDRVVHPHEEAAIFETIEALRQEQPQYDWWTFARLVRLFLDTGGRLSETLQLGPSSVRIITKGDRTETYLFFPADTAKSQKARMVPASNAIAAMLPELTSRSVGGRWFPFKVSWTQHRWRQVRDRLPAECASLTIHTFRHTCLTRLLQGGMDIVRVSRWAGHANIRVTVDRYGHLEAGDLMGGIDILERHAGWNNPVQNGDSPTNVIITDV